MKDIPPAIPDQPTRLFDRLRAEIRARGLSYATEKTYLLWIRRFILFNSKRHPRDMAELEVERFLKHLAVNRNVAINTRKTALNALVFPYRSATINKPLGQLSVTAAKVHRRVPAVFTQQEARLVIDQLNGVYNLIAKLMYGAGLRISEVLRLRVSEVDFDRGLIIVRSGKGVRTGAHYCLSPVAFR